MVKHKGFTIIEIVLVLAIAGLIFLMVFIALPALQRNQRDTRRKSDVNRLADALERYKANNQGRLPWSGYFSFRPANIDGFMISYMKSDEGEFNDPGGEIYRINFASESIAWSVESQAAGPYIHISRGTKCSGSDRVPAGGIYNYSIQIKLESGSYCVDG